MVMNKLTHSPDQFTFQLRRFRPIGLGVGLILIAGGTIWWFSQAGQDGPSSNPPVSAKTTAPIRVETAIARRQNIAADRILTGTVEAMETVTLTSRVMGHIRQLTVQEGDAVKAGAPLVVIDVADLQAQGIQVLAGVNMAQSNYQNAQARLQEAQAQLVEAEAELADAKLEQRRMKMLQAEGAVSQQLLDRANTRVQMTAARIDRSKAGIRQSQAMMNQTQSQIKQAQAQMDQVSANLNYGTIAAPFDGIVTRKHTEVGAMAGAGQPLLTVESSDRLRFSTQVPESLIRYIRQGQGVTVHLDAVNRDLSGTVSQIIPSADPVTRNFTVKVRLNEARLNRTDAVIPGMFGRLKLAAQQSIPTHGSRIALLIPRSAMVQQFGITGVYKIKNRQAVFQPITTGKPQGAEIEVFAGLGPGDQLILEPFPELKDGTPVQVN